MPHDIDHIIQIKKAAEADLLNRPGVTGVDVGYKYVAGRRTDDIVIRVHVAEKGDVPPDQKIPDTIQGVKTDILQNRFQPTGDRGYYNPILGGIDIGPLRAVDGESMMGTLGAIVIDNSTQERMLLSNYHVLCVNEGWDQWGDVGRRITQPSVGGILIATIQRGILNSEMDAAVARLDGMTKYVCELQDIGPITGTAAPALGMAVRKRGRTTGLTYGTIEGLSLSVIIDYGHGVGRKTLQDQIHIAPNTKFNNRFAEEGDSGSVVVNDAGAVIGLLFSSALESGGAATPIDVVLKKLNVSLAIEGIGGFDLSDSADRAFAFDYIGNGKLDHLVLYRPGKGFIWILKKDSAGNFSPVYQARDGIGGYDLSDPADRMLAFDYDGTGTSRYLVLYRPGKGAIFILVKDGVGTYYPFYQAKPGSGGIGGFDLSDPADRVFAFDYASNGKLDHLVLYRPGKGFIWILKKDSARKFSPVYQARDGIGGFDLSDSADRAFAFDYASNGKLDHLVLYRPGKGFIWILKKDNAGNFSPVYQTRGGIGGFDLSDSADQAFAFDYDGKGKQDHLVLYRPGTGFIWILKKDNAEAFSPVYQARDGIGGFDLSDPAGRVFAFDYASNGKLDHLVLYRPGKGFIWILKKDRTGKFSPVYQARK